MITGATATSTTKNLGLPLQNAPESTVYQMDCLKALKQYPDNYFDLAVVDPPYSIADNPSRHGGSGKLKNRVLNKSVKKFKQWDKKPPAAYFKELMRVSKYQIVWGGNYFDLPPTRGIICWDKMQPWPNFSQIEYAWTSYDKPAKLFRYDNRTGDKIHPTQKPVKLYDWIFKNYAEPGQKILDTHLGSGSSRIAAHKAGLNFTGFELDPEYFTAAEKRFKQAVAQTRLF